MTNEERRAGMRAIKDVLLEIASALERITEDMKPTQNYRGNRNAVKRCLADLLKARDALGRCQMSEAEVQTAENLLKDLQLQPDRLVDSPS